MLSVLQYDYPQIPLIHIVYEDDLVLLDAPDAAWFEVLYNFPWKDYQIYAAQYYDALYISTLEKQGKGRGRGKARKDGRLDRYGWGARPEEEPQKEPEENPVETLSEKKSKQTWARLIKRIYEVDPLICS